MIIRINTVLDGSHLPCTIEVDFNEYTSVSGVLDARSTCIEKSVGNQLKNFAAAYFVDNISNHFRKLPKILAEKFRKQIQAVYINPNIPQAA